MIRLAVLPVEHPVLLGGGQPGVQRQHLQAGLPVQRVGGVPDLPFAAEEDEDVAGPVGAQLGDRVQDALDLVLRFLVRVVGVGQRPVPHLDRVGAPGHLDDRCPELLEVLGETFRVDRGRGNDDLEIRAAWEQALEVAEDEVDVEAALVRLVDDERVVAEQLPVAGHLGEQDAVRHHLDQRAVAGGVGEPDLVADRGAQLGAELARDPLRDRAGRDPARLGVPDLPGHPPAELEADLRQLGRLPRAGLPGHDHDLVVPDGRRDLVPPLADRELRRVTQGGDAGPPGLGPGLRRIQVGPQPAQRTLARGRVGQRGGLLGAVAEPALIAEHQPGQPVLKLSERGGHGGNLHGGTGGEAGGGGTAVRQGASPGPDFLTHLRRGNFPGRGGLSRPGAR